jgi:hypothetical protein
MQFREDNIVNKSLIRKDETGDRKLIPAITIQDIDYAILWQLQTGMKLKIESNEEMIDVPVMMAAGEKWAQIQKYGALLRTSDNKLMAPLIVIKRQSLAEDEMFKFSDVAGKLIYLPPKNKADKFNNLSRAENTNESYEYLLSVIPTTVIVNYELMIWTHQQTQLNSIVEQLMAVDQALWGDNLQFSTDVGEFNFELINNSGEDRVIRATVPLTVHGMLRNEYTANVSDVQKAFTIKRVDFTNEWGEPDFTVDYMPKSKIIGPKRLKITPSMLNEDLT